MSLFDIRSSVENIDVIQFADDAVNVINAKFISKQSYVVISDERDYRDGDWLNIVSQEDAENLISALQKAIDLGWFI